MFDSAFNSTIQALLGAGGVLTALLVVAVGVLWVIGVVILVLVGITKVIEGVQKALKLQGRKQSKKEEVV